MQSRLDSQVIRFAHISPIMFQWGFHYTHTVLIIRYKPKYANWSNDSIYEK